MTGRKRTEALLTTGEVARMLHIHINTARRWSNQGLLPSCRIGPRGDRRFRRKDIASLLTELRPHRTNHQEEPESLSQLDRHQSSPN